ncbi:hypothetical protein [Paludisphaera borealis]|uniref:Uncharacterized protein n=1 Tax=Paludisphaera borealis TaxID=1387353 RepID=A0A1U7CX40_9BACT|nr:hypothetical protein [Paludisphaera borealis]APW63520.1 hypothetical protein BSF38_05092 [Paludisphaera borealis]
MAQPWQIKIDDELNERAKGRARELGRTLSNYIRHLVQQDLKADPKSASQDYWAKVRSVVEPLKARLAESGEFAPLNIAVDPLVYPELPNTVVWIYHKPSGRLCGILFRVDEVHFWIQKNDHLELSRVVCNSTYENPAIVDEIIAKFTAA